MTSAHADPEPGTDGDDGERHYLTAAIWAALELGITGTYYWSTQREQSVDWVYPSWRDKLTLRALSFDTNPFRINAIRHPLAGIGDYQIARSNGFGVIASTVFTDLASVIWEFGMEYREDPAINDLIMNGVGGLSIGEPLYQIGQLWRGGEPSAADRLRTAAFSPFAAAQDLWRPHPAWWRRRLAWSDFAFSGGLVSHRLDGGGVRPELALGADIDVVRHPGFVTPGAHAGRIEPGSWSRIALGGRLGDAGAGEALVATGFRSQTSVVGTYVQDDAGDGRLLALGTGFTYRRDRLASAWDHVAIGHLVGPQLQLSRRTGATELRWDLAAYADFAMIDAHVFKPHSPLPPPPPYRSTVQSQGYYDAAGASIGSRARIDHGAWHADLEATGHQLWSLDFADRAAVDANEIAPPAVAVVARASTPIPATPHGMADLRLYGHAQLGVRGDLWGVAATADAAYRRGTWRELERATSDWTVGLAATAHW